MGQGVPPGLNRVYSKSEAYFSGESDEKDKEIDGSEQRDGSCILPMIRMFIVLTLKSSWSNVGENQNDGRQSNLGLHADHAAVSEILYRR